VGVMNALADLDEQAQPFFEAQSVLVAELGDGRPVDIFHRK